jgi:hypothetical protein
MSGLILLTELARTHMIDTHHYNIRLEGCNHEQIMTDTQLVTERKGQRIHRNTGIKEDLYFCNGCLEGKPGCNTIINGSLLLGIILCHLPNQVRNSLIHSIRAWQ